MDVEPGELLLGAGLCGHDSALGDASAAGEGEAHGAAVCPGAGNDAALPQRLYRLGRGRHRLLETRALLLRHANGGDAHATEPLELDGDAGLAKLINDASLKIFLLSPKVLITKTRT